MGSVEDLYSHDHHHVHLPLHYLLDEGIRVLRWMFAPVVTVNTRSSGQGLRRDEEGEEGVIRPISDEKRRERLRSFFTRRREESSPDSDDEEEKSPEKKPRFKPRNRFVRPTAAKPKEVESDDSEVDDDDLEGFSQSVSVSQSVSTSVSTRRVRPITRIFQNRNEEKK